MRARGGEAARTSFLVRLFGRAGILASSGAGVVEQDAEDEVCSLNRVWPSKSFVREVEVRSWSISPYLHRVSSRLVVWSDLLTSPPNEQL